VLKGQNKAGLVSFQAGSRIDLIAPEDQDAPALRLKPIGAMVTHLAARKREFVLGGMIGHRVGGIPAIAGVTDIVNPERCLLVTIVVGTEWNDALCSTLAAVIAGDPLD
jgi:hypothetical protein